MPHADLTDFIEEVTGESHLRVEDDLGDGFVVLRVSEAERRQARHDVRSSEDIVIEMLRNARDAHAKNIFLATSREGSMRRIVMLDDGDGIPAHMLKRIFDARVTSKLDSMHIDTWGVHGRGMALYAIRMNTEKAFVAASKVGGGSSFVIESNTTLLPEKTDQSSMPVFVRSDDGKITVRGTRNINRTAAEFSFVNKDTCTLYMGSPVEIAATLWDFGKLLLPASTRAFCTNVEDVDVCKRLALSSTPEDFCYIAAGLGLNLSERSARRIIDDEIKALSPFVDFSVVGANTPSKKKKKRKTARDIVKAHDARGLKLTEDDKQKLKQGVEEQFRTLAEQYYLEPEVEATIHIHKDAIHITIPVRLQR